MKILSLNINKFRGIDDQERKLNEQDKQTAESVCENIIAYAPDIIIFEEFDSTKSAKDIVDVYIEKLEDYTLFVPYSLVGRKLENYRGKNSFTSLTVCLIHKRMPCFSIDNIKEFPGNWVNTIKINYKNTIITGVHMKYDRDHWEALKKEFDDNKNKNLIMIGDFNTWDKATGSDDIDFDAKDVYEEYFKPMLDNGVVDICPSGIMTFKKVVKETRIDHILIPEHLAKKINKVSVTVDGTFINDKLSDHAALILDIDDETLFRDSNSY